MCKYVKHLSLEGKGDEAGEGNLQANVKEIFHLEQLGRGR
jgi:hypothetical protein